MRLTPIVRSLLVVLVTVCATARAGTIYVSTTGNDARDGFAWATAKKTVQAGLNAAAAGDQVWVAAGTYVENITLKGDVALYGGFAGDETDLGQRNWTTNVTILDGNQVGTVVTSPTGATPDTRIDGFTVRNGKAAYGGGIYCNHSSPTITNNTITGNAATDTSSGYGGGICCEFSSAVVQGNTITGNSAAHYGGAIYYYSGSGSITGNTISGNTASYNGGGIACSLSPGTTISHNTITGNSAPYGGGTFCSAGFTLTNNTIMDNQATQGAAIYCYSSGTITNNTITANAASGEGGGVYFDWSSATLANNTITGNRASSRGGGIHCYYSTSLAITNNTIVGNSASANGGAIYCEYSSPAVANTIVAANSSGILCSVSSTPSFRCNCVYGNGLFNYLGLSDPTGINGNISADPKLAGPGYGDVHIQPGSPCIDSGNDSVVQPGWTDMGVQPRMQGAHVDIGADESDGTAWPGGPKIIVRVAPDGDDANDGSSWSAPKRTVQAGIDEVAGVGGDVWVKAGTYIERINLPDLAHVYGGFAGTESQRSERNWSRNVTILDGSQAGSVVTATGTAYGLSTLDGFTIRNGSGAPSGVGGGICCTSSSPVVAHNSITGNTAHWGGGIYCHYACPIITANTIAGNAATGSTDYGSGGGIYCASAAIIIGNVIKENTALGAHGGGGGIYCGGPSQIVSNAIIGNTATGTYGIGGGIYCYSSSPTIANNTIASNNTASGGGVYCDMESSPTVVNTIVAFNSSGIGTLGAMPTVRNSCAYGNAAYNYSGFTDPTGSNGNISIDPQLANAAYGDTHIQPASPCIDAGDDSVVQPGWMDIDGQPRILGAHVDIGAYESDGRLWPSGPNVLVCVTPEGDDANDGSSWALAKRTIQAGIDTAAASGGEVWVKAGTYLERITLRNFAHVYGGFGGTELKRSDRDWSTHPTILDGNQGGSVVTAQQTGTGWNTIDGFTIQNGKAAEGGGIYCAYASPTIANNTIVSNVSTDNASAGGGGGISCCTASPTIANNTIRANSALSGGGISCYAWASPTITNNTITGNSGTGGIYSYSASPTIANNTITNHSTSGVYSWNGSVTVTKNTICGNGSGVYCNTSHATIVGNTIVDNGGGISCSYAPAMILNNTISRNSAAGSGGGIYCYSASPTMVANNVIVANTASYGGGLCSSNTSLTIANNTIAANSAGSGGGIYCQSASAVITNSIVAFNSSGIYKSGSGAPSLRYDCVYGNTAYNYAGIVDPTGTNGNISVDPLLSRAPSPRLDSAWGTSDDDYGDLHLLTGSPCVNAGDPAYVPTPDETDFDGRPRVLYGRVDIGADEFQFAGDCNFDGFVNVGDLQVLVTSWGSSRTAGGSYSVGADLNGDGFVNVGDLQLLVANWGKSLQ